MARVCVVTRNVAEKRAWGARWGVGGCKDASGGGWMVTRGRLNFRLAGLCKLGSHLAEVWENVVTGWWPADAWSAR